MPKGAVRREFRAIRRITHESRQNLRQDALRGKTQEQLEMKAEIKHRSDSRLVIGSALIIVGALLAIEEAGYLQFLDLNRTWPLIVIALAFVRLHATMSEPRQRGWALLLLGDWLFANTMT